MSAAQDTSLNLRFCTLHIIRNIIHRFGRLHQDEKNLVWGVQSSETEYEYKERMKDLGLVLGSQVCEYLKSIEPYRWCVFANMGKVKLYGWRTSNFVESVFGSQLISGIRYLPPFEFIRRLCEKLLHDTYRRASNARLWTGEVTLGTMRLLATQTEDIGAYVVMKSCLDVSFVVDRRTTTRRLRSVQFSTKKCSCSFMDQYGVPCRHFVAALAEYEKEDTIPEYFDSCYRVDTYREAFADAAVRLPLDTESAPDETCIPPFVAKKTGRPKSKRIRSNGE